MKEKVNSDRWLACSRRDLKAVNIGINLVGIDGSGHVSKTGDIPLGGVNQQGTTQKGFFGEGDRMPAEGDPGIVQSGGAARWRSQPV